MTDREKAIVMAYTGAVMLSGDKLEVFYQYVKEKLGHCVMTHELAFPEIQDAIADAAKDDFIELAKGNNVPADGWISVKDRPPEFYEEVNVAEHGVFEPWLVTSASLHKDGRFYRGGNIMIDAKFWQPLPEPPKEGEHESLERNRP